MYMYLHVFINNNKIIIAAFIMRTYPSSEDVQGATFYYYPGRWIQFQDRTYSAQFPLPMEHSLPSCLSWRSGKYIHNTSFTSYRIPIYTPGWRAAMWIKCLAEGQKCQAWTGIEPATLWSRVKGSLQYVIHITSDKVVWSHLISIKFSPFE